MKHDEIQKKYAFFDPDFWVIINGWIELRQTIEKLLVFNPKYRCRGFL